MTPITTPYHKLMGQEAARTLTRIALLYLYFGRPEPRAFLRELQALSEQDRRELAAEASLALGVQVAGWS